MKSHETDTKKNFRERLVKFRGYKKKPSTKSHETDTKKTFVKD